jgi:methylphosphotriester-DNA--protein-cysteine methyltransferase
MNKLFGFGTIVFLAALAAGPAPAQTSSPDSATIQALLSEVRQLRRTVETKISLGPRMQILIQRAQFQEQKLLRVQQQLDDVRKQISDQTARQTAANDRLAKIEQEISAESDAARRTQLEDMRTGLKMVVGNAPDQQLRGRESDLSSALDTEQAALNELNEKLDALERQLEAPLADAQPPAPR